MGKVKRLTLDRYEHVLLVRALYEEWQRMQAERKPTEDMEDLILKVIDPRAIRALALMRLNRRVPNGTHGGVRGRAPHGALLLDAVGA